MRNSVSFPSSPSISFHGRLLAVLTGRLWLVIGLLIVLTAYFTFWQATPAVNWSADETGMRPDRPLLISFSPLHLTITNAMLYETPREESFAGPPQVIPVALVLLPAANFWETAQIRLVGRDGNSPLRPDSSYSLTINAEWNLLSAAWLKLGEWTTTYRFSTLPSPKPFLPAAQVRPRYQAAITLDWDIPVSSVDYRISPSVASSFRVDQDNARRTYLELQGYEPGQTYVIQIVGAMATNGMSLQQPYSFSAIMPKPPRVSLVNPHLSQLNKEIVLNWDEPVTEFEFKLDPPAQATITIDPSNRQRASINIQSLKQGQEYQLVIEKATAENGLQLQQPYSFALTSAPGLDLIDITPSDGRFGVKPNQSVHLVFGEEVIDRAAAERAVSFSPSVPGHFEWPSNQELVFVPGAPFPFESEVTVRAKGGLDGVRGRSGSYLEEDFSFQFITRPNKLIDVDLTKQLVRLFEGDQVVLTSLTSTGVRGDETPTGNYMVQYKITSTRMRGRLSSGSYYDVPNVPWVLVFSGDYTIHGAYWRRGFGFPQSAGCVSLSVPTAKQVFDWVPVGTPITIHY